MANTWIVVGVILLGGLIQGTAGFGLGLFSMGMLIMLVPVSEAVVFVAVGSLVSTMLNWWTVRESLPWPEMWPILISSLPTTALGIYALCNLESGILQIGVALMILAGCAVALWPSQTTRIDRAFPWAYIAGLIGGLFGGGLNMGGPPIVLYTLLRGWKKSKAKSIMATYFLMIGTLRLILLVTTGVATRELLKQSLWVIPASLIASYVGTRIFDRMSTRVFRYAATVILVGLAIKIVAT
ncbi:MAG: sulfite exporter TauE/SafE family protein [Chloroflexota bacterium]|nr:sulfite exporter TauE/SafE family protein [Chloroflexota bacterium]